jgi:hypothetical protein
MLIAKLLTMLTLSFVITVLEKPMENDSDKCLSVNQDRHSQVLGSFCIFLVKTLWLLSADTSQQFKSVSISSVGQLDLINSSLRAISKINIFVA